MRGRKNHGVRQARWAKMWKRALRRRSHFKNGRKKHWKQSYTHLHFPYVRSRPPVRHQLNRLLPLHRVVKKPKKNVYGVRYSVFVTQFLGGGSTNPHTHVYPPYNARKHFPASEPILFQTRLMQRYGKRVNKLDREAFILAKASRWHWGTVLWHARVPAFQVGWPIWDPKGRTPQQIVYRFNI